jgi:predicted DNA-binding transcriptional regulator AlpA
MESSNNAKLLNFEESAEYLGFSRHTLAHQFFTKNQKTKPEPSYVGNRLFFKKRNLDKYVDELPTTVEE